MADRGSTSGKLPTSTMFTRKRMKQGSDTKRGFTKINIGDQFDCWMGISVTLHCVAYVFTVRGKTYLVPDCRHICFQKFMLPLQFIYSTFCHEEAHLTSEAN